jgi:UDP-N-acetyl-2-amino-2-deoxyglucuronate dehydrogenase
MSDALRTAVIGCGPMARWHVKTICALPEYELVALCDLDETHARALSEAVGRGEVYSDCAQMLMAQRPDVAVIVTPCATHAALAIQAAEAGVRGVYCEKPMATCLGDGRAMVQACRERGVALAVNHQRRMSPPILKMKELIDEGAVGEVELYRGSCGGDLLSDATHLVDTIRFLAADAPVTWVFGGLHREIGPEVARNPKHVQLASAGFRYGHAIETGAFGIFEFATGVRTEVLCGDLRLMKRAYGDYEVFGTQGRLWRPGDGADPPLLIQDQRGGWRPVEGLSMQDEYAETAAACYRRFGRMVTEGAEHPLSGESALADLEIIMAIFESARLRQRIELPLQQDRFPLEMMIAP